MFVIKRNRDGKYVARSGSVSSYTNDRSQAVEYSTIEEADDERCGNESIYYSCRETLIKEGQL